MMISKFAVIAILLCAPPLALANDPAVDSRVFPWEDTTATKLHFGEARHVLKGTSLDLSELDVNAYTLDPGKTSSRAGKNPGGVEQLVIVKSGELDISIGGKTETLGPGSVAVFIPGGEHALANNSDEPATFFLFDYKTVAGFDAGRAQEAGGSFFVDWDELEYVPSDIGGRRGLYDRPTGMLSRFQVHVSTLNAGLTNHPAHTHRVEEMVLVIKGEVEMLIGESHYMAKAGDLYFIQSEVPHSLRNIGDEQTEYYAIQWR